MDKILYRQNENGIGENGIDNMVGREWYGKNRSNFWNRLTFK